MGTLNPDDPNLSVYKEYINCSRPLSEWQQETPKEIMEELRAEPKPGWVHWFFSFTHNLGLSKEKLENIIWILRRVQRYGKIRLKDCEGKRPD